MTHAAPVAPPVESSLYYRSRTTACWLTPLDRSTDVQLVASRFQSGVDSPSARLPSDQLAPPLLATSTRNAVFADGLLTHVGRRSAGVTVGSAIVGSVLAEDDDDQVVQHHLLLDVSVSAAAEPFLLVSIHLPAARLLSAPALSASLPLRC